MKEGESLFALVDAYRQGKRRRKAPDVQDNDCAISSSEKHNRIKEQPWRGLEIISETLDDKKTLRTKATQMCQSNKLPPSLFSSSFHITMRYINNSWKRVQASKPRVLWGHKEALPLLSRSSLGEFWRRLPGRQAGNLSLAVLGQPQPRCENTINRAAFVKEIRPKKTKKKCCWNFKRTNKSLILRVFESLFPESFLGFGGDGDGGERDEESAPVFVREMVTVYLCGGTKLGRKSGWKRHGCRIISFDVQIVFWCFHFSPNNSLLCDIRFFHAQILI